MQLRTLAFGLMIVMLVAAPFATAQDVGFRLGAGDKLRITVFEEPDMSGEFVIGARGRLSLPLIGEIVASDLTLSELEIQIKEALADGFIQDASVSVELLESRPFYILGDVSNPGSYPYVDGMTVVNAIALAGGGVLTQEDEVRSMVEVARSRERRDLLAKDYLSTLAREARLVAERDQLESIAFPPALKAASEYRQFKTIIDGESRIFEARRSILDDQFSVIQELKASVRKEISAYNTQMAAMREQVSLLNQLLEDQNKLLSQNLTRKSAVLELRIQGAASKVSRGNLLVQLARAEQRLQELDLQVTASRNEFISEVADGLNETQGELSRLRISLQTAEEEFRQNRRKLGRARSALAGERTQRIEITRKQRNGGVILIDAEESTPIAPGDIVKVIDVLDQGLDDVSFDITSLIASFRDRDDGPETTTNTDANPADVEPADESSDGKASAPSSSGDNEVNASHAEPSPEATAAEDASEERLQEAQTPPSADTTVSELAQPADAELSEETPAQQLVEADQSADLEASSLLKSVQIGLNVLGYTGERHLSIDGIMGPRTRDAIKAYQTRNNMPADGNATPELLAHIQTQLN